MPYCEKCGSQISENASFCHSCGARVIGEVEINDACVSDENTYQEDEYQAVKSERFINTMLRQSAEY